MRSLPRAGLLMVAISFLAIPYAVALGHDTPANRDSADTLGTSKAPVAELPKCMQTCLETIFLQQDCTVDSACYCADKLATALEKCAAASCQLPDYIGGQKLYTDGCDRPRRNKGPETRRLNWAMFVVATFFISGRFIGRMRSLGGSGFGLDDWVALLAYALVVPTDVTSELEVQHGLGMDMWSRPMGDVVVLMKAFYFGEVLYSCIIVLTKISLVLLYLRIWPADSVTQNFRLACWVLAAALTSFLIAGTIALTLQCNPINYVWLQVTGEVKGTCINLKALVYAHGGLNVLFDFIVILLPVHVLLRMKFPISKKAGLCAVFLIGFLVTICSLIRLQYAKLVDGSKNLTWDFHPIGIWSLIEANFSVVVCCMPALAGLLQRMWSKLFGTPPQMGYSMVSGDDAFPERIHHAAQPATNPEMALEQWEHDAQRNLEAESQNA